MVDSLITTVNDIANVLQEGLGLGDIKKYRKRVRDVVKQANIGFDKLLVEGNGTVTAARTLFYRGGNSSNTIIQKLVDVFEKDDAKLTILETRDEWKKWPTTSYFVIRFKVSFRKKTNSNGDNEKR